MSMDAYVFATALDAQKSFDDLKKHFPADVKKIVLENRDASAGLYAFGFAAGVGCDPIARKPTYREVRDALRSALLLIGEVTTAYAEECRYNPTFTGKDPALVVSARERYRGLSDIAQRAEK